MAEQVVHPSHYNEFEIECIDVVKHFSFMRGSAIKYLWRAGAKGDIVTDLKKAVYYIEREIEDLEAAAEPEGPTIEQTFNLRKSEQTEETLYEQADRVSQEAQYVGSNRRRQEAGLPGHCEKCARYGHVKAHPHLGCSDVGCTEEGH